jgi:sugar phosphate isomerase/epimerase
VRIGVFTDGLSHLDRQAALAWCAERGIHDVEMGVGTWSPRPHLDLASLLRDPAARDALLGELAEHDVRLAAVNAAGNPLHPDPARRREAQDALRGAIELAALLHVDRVVTMSGCPGGRDGAGGTGIFGVWSICSDDEGLWEWQLREQVGPFWAELSRWAADIAPQVRICLELHPGVTVFGVEGFRRLQAFVGDNVGVNLDPSHFWWQGVDPVAVIEALGPAIGFAHGKDTTIHADRVRLHGVLDARYPVDAATAAWHFSAVGRGHGSATWRALLDALRRAGHDGVVSIEHEDPTLDGEQGIELSLAGLRAALEVPVGESA